MGFAIVIGIFGLTLFGSTLSAFAKDVPKGCPNPTDIPPTGQIVPAPPSNKSVIKKSLTGLAGAIVVQAVHAGSFLFGVILGYIIVAVILHAEGK